VSKVKILKRFENVQPLKKFEEERSVTIYTKARMGINYEENYDRNQVRSRGAKRRAKVGD